MSTAATRGLLATVNVQLFAKFTVLFVNLGFARYVPRHALGTAAVSFQLLDTLALALLKETFRKAALREKKEASQRVVISHHNLIWFGSMISVALTVVLGLIWGVLVPANFANTPQKILFYRISVCLVTLGIVFIALAEPYIVGLLKDNAVPTKFAIVGGGHVVRAVSIPMTFLVLRWTTQLDPSIAGLLSFGVGNLLNGIVQFVVAKYKCSAEMRLMQRFRSMDATAKRLYVSRYVLKEDMMVLKEYCSLTIIKSILNEFDRLVLVFAYPDEDWGHYAVISNLGSSIVRVLYVPSEECAAVAFSRVDDFEQARDIFPQFYWLQTMFGAFFASILPPYAWDAVQILHGSLWSSDFVVITGLRFFAYYITFEAANGMLDVFVSAVASPLQLQRYKRHLLRISLLSISCCLCLRPITRRALTTFRLLNLGDASVLVDVITIISIKYITVALRSYVALTFLGRGSFRNGWIFVMKRGSHMTSACVYVLCIASCLWYTATSHLCERTVRSLLPSLIYYWSAKTQAPELILRLVCDAILGGGGVLCGLACGYVLTRVFAPALQAKNHSI